MKSKKEIANQLGIHPSTLYKRMKKLGIECKKGFISVENANEIIKKISQKA
jgi:DNA-binding Lrp family transcriptional regulator